MMNPTTMPILRCSTFLTVQGLLLLLLLLLLATSIPQSYAYHVSRRFGGPTIIDKRPRRRGGDSRTSSLLLLHSSSSRSNRPNNNNVIPHNKNRKVSPLIDWAKSNDVQISSAVTLQEATDSSGLGWFVKRQQKQDSSTFLQPGSILVSVPSPLALTIEAPGQGPDDPSILRELIRKDQRKIFTNDLPWFVQFSVYLYKLRRVKSSKQSDTKDRMIDLRPWINSLPQSFDSSTPLHWNNEARQQLQYEPILQAIQQQEQQWQHYYQKITQQVLLTAAATAPQLSWNDFVWGCEIARSRAFSGGYAGTPFNPFLYAFTLVLVAAYVGLGLGTIEQAANGVGVVLCAFVLQDFVFPKVLARNTKRYVICPLIDMTNHRSTKPQAQVSYEFFTNAYSLALSSSSTSAAITSTSSTSQDNDEEMFISYGTRSNDQLLQYYGFVEVNNPNEVYLLPPLRDWDLALLEQACQRTIQPGRLAALDRAGLLGTSLTNAPSESENPDDTDDDTVLNKMGRVVVTRAMGVDPAVMQALRALVSTDAEWERAGKSVGSFATEHSGGIDNDRCARQAAQAALQHELKLKPTTLKQDQLLLRQMESRTRSLDMSSPEEVLALQFRIEKKKLLLETIDKLT